jgi:ribosomal protein L11 methyltransferase
MPAPHPFRLVAPEALGAATPGPLDLVVGGSAFGGGRHPTTVRCLEVLAALAPLHGLEVLDLGCGSGILAVAALRLGALRATGVDVSPDAVASAEANARLNGLSDRLALRQGTAESVAGTAFDLVVANIGGELLLDLAPIVAPLVRPGGRLLLSGLLSGWAEDLAAAYARLGCALLERSDTEGFCALLLRRT